jgi:glycosyltransferase involved in cell wall biosynthesis
VRELRKRILILVENLPVPFDRRVWMEATTLAEAGYEVSVVCPSGDYPVGREDLEGVRVYRYPVPSLAGIAGHALEYGWALPVTFALACYVFLRHGFDAIHGANPPDFFFLVAAPFKLLGVKFVFDHHDLVPELCESRWTGRRRSAMRAVATWAERATFRAADFAIATNQSYRDVAVHRGGLPPERVRVVRSAPSMARYRPAEPRPELKNGRAHLVAYIGVMGPNDGIEHLLAAIAHVVHALGRHDVQFVLIGGGDLQPRMAEAARDLGLGGFVRFTGRIPEAEAVAILSTADVCVAPDPKDPLNDLSSMNKVVEYMALAKPLVAFELREARRSAGEAALYAVPNDTADFGNKIVELLDAPERRQAMGEVGRQRFESVLAWEYQKDALLRLYGDLFAEAE